MLRLTICDDERRRRERLKSDLESVASIRSSFEVSYMLPGAFRDEMQLLRARRREARGRKSPGGERQSVFDSTDLLLVDFDLMEYASYAADGEGVAYLARCYSRCGYVIEINEFGGNTFDLTLEDHPRSFADLNLGGDQLTNPGLWSAQSRGYRPWMWPNLSKVVADFRKCVADVLENPNAKILEFFQLEKSDLSSFSRPAIELLLGTRSLPEKATFASVVKTSELGLLRSDRPMNDETIAAVAAARVAKWLGTAVLARQDVLVDAPHLVDRLPSLMKGDLTRSELDKCAAFDEASLSDVLRLNSIKQYKFARPHWLSRPTWYWSRIRRDETISEIKSPFDAATLKYRFCEDVSRFLPVDACREVILESGTPYRTRYVLDQRSDFGRQFTLRFLSKPGRIDPRDLTKVDYQPAYRVLA